MEKVEMGMKLQEEEKGIYVDRGSWENLLGVYRKGWIYPVHDYRLKNFAEFLLRKRDFRVLVSPLSSRCYLFPHQLSVAEWVNQRMGGRGILADEVGLGKTIEAGMIMKELILRGLVERILIIVPASLVTQWEEEMRHRFNENFTIYDTEKRRELQRKYGEKENIWAVKNRILVSLNTAKQRGCREQIQAVEWDLVIVDESHRMKNSSTQNYKLVHGLKTKYLLLLTATPLQNYLLELYNLVNLIDPELLGNKSGFKRRFEERIHDPVTLENLRKRLKRVMIRNRRADVGDSFTYTRRRAVTVPVELDPASRRLYDLTTQYAMEGYRKSLANQSYTYGFYTMLVQRLLSSSVEALKTALQKRLELLEEVKSGKKKPARLKDLILVELDARGKEEEQFFSDPGLIHSIETEMQYIQTLLNAAEEVKTSPKLTLLKKILEEIFSQEDNEKVVIFTEFRSTQEFLAEKLREEGYDVVVFHGGMTLKEKDAAVEHFEEEGQILISTEAGSEGQNLQFAHIMINYDLPWNPMKLEQRIGRIHRIGQKRDVEIFNLVIRESIEEYLLKVLEQKIGLFREIMGDLETILGAISRDKGFEHYVMELISRTYSEKKGNLAEAFSLLEKELDEARKQVDGSLFNALDKRGMDLSLSEHYERFRNYSCGKDEVVLKLFMEDFLDKYNVLRDRTSEYLDFKVPSHLASGYVFSDQIKGTLLRQVALEKPYLEFLGIGHSFVTEALRESAALTPITTGIMNASFLHSRGIYPSLRQGIVASFLVQFRFADTSEERFYIVFSNGKESLVSNDMDEGFFYLQELPPDFLADLPLEHLLDVALHKLLEQVRKDRHELFQKKDREFKELIQYIRDYYSDLRYDQEILADRIQQERKILEQKYNAEEVGYEEYQARKQVLDKAYARHLMNLVELKKKEKEKISQLEQSAGINVYIRPLSLAKVLVVP
ncbi:MAG: SNF2-related protein [bacterium JZ-2024 1]